MMPSPSNLAIGGIPVVVSDHLPLTPSDGEVARRIVRHGLARVLEQLGEGVGPRPEDQTEVLLIDGSMFMSEDAHDRVRAVVAMTGTQIEKGSSDDQSQV